MTLMDNLTLPYHILQTCSDISLRKCYSKVSQVIMLWPFSLCRLSVGGNQQNWWGPERRNKEGPGGQLPSPSLFLSHFFHFAHPVFCLFPKNDSLKQVNSHWMHQMNVQPFVVLMQISILKLQNPLLPDNIKQWHMILVQLFLVISDLRRKPLL